MKKHPIISYITALLLLFIAFALCDTVFFALRESVGLTFKGRNMYAFYIPYSTLVGVWPLIDRRLSRALAPGLDAALKAGFAAALAAWLFIIPPIVATFYYHLAVLAFFLAAAAVSLVATVRGDKSPKAT